jgi:hypothetical protein
VTEEMEVEDEEAIQRAVVAAEIAEMALLRSNISTGLESLIANLTSLIHLQNKHISEDETSAAVHGSLLYQHNNKMGAFDLKNSSGFITFDDLENGMIDSTTQSKVERKCGDATFYAKTGDVYNCWVPDRAK